MNLRTLILTGLIASSAAPLYSINFSSMSMPFDKQAVQQTVQNLGTQFLTKLALYKEQAATQLTTLITNSEGMREALVRSCNQLGSFIKNNSEGACESLVHNRNQLSNFVKDNKAGVAISALVLSQIFLLYKIYSTGKQVANLQDQSVCNTEHLWQHTGDIYQLHNRINRTEKNLEADSLI